MPEPTAPATTTDQGAESIAPEQTSTTSVTKPETPKPSFTAEQQAYLNDIVQTRVKAAQQKAADDARKEADEKTAKTVEEQVAAIREQLETQARASEATAVRSIVARAAAGTHNPAVATQLITAQLGDLTSADEGAILAKAAEFLTANAYLVKTPTSTAPVVTTPAPGVTETPTEAAYFTREQLDAITDKELAKDEELLKKYLKSIDHLAAQGR